MICPSCGAAYPRGFSQCTHCEVRLVPEASASADSDPATLAGSVLRCPECGGEYRHGVAECADCEVPLVPRPAPAGAEHQPNMAKLTEVAEPALLPVVVGLLESAGIEPLVEGDEIMGLLPVGRAFAGLSGGGRGLSAVLWVPTDRLEEARALLADVEERASTEAE